MSFILKMAWRDSRASRRRLLLLSISIVLGIAALVAIGSVSANLRRAIDNQAGALLGADLVVSGPIPTSPEWQSVLKASGAKVARERLAAVNLTAGSHIRRVQLRAVEGDFPFYGEFQTEPADAVRRLKEGGRVAVLDPDLLGQMDLKVGDSFAMAGHKEPFVVIGTLKAFPGEPPAFGAVQPRVFIPFAALPVGPAGAANRLNVKMPAGGDPDALVRTLKASFGADTDPRTQGQKAVGIGVDRLFFATVTQRHRDLEKALTGFDAFFHLVGFVGLFLGGIGVASVIHVYVRQKIPTVAVLRCLGATAGQSFAIYLVQGFAIGIFGAAVGAGLGLAAQRTLPVLLKDLIPFHVDFFISWPAVAEGMGSGLVICLLFTLLPLLSVRLVPPLAAFRSALAERTGLGFDPWRIVVAVAIPAAVAGFAVWQTKSVKFGLGYTAALAAGFALLGGTAALVSWAARRFPLRGFPYVVRQGVANLHRPNNRTLLLLLSLGLGAYLVIALYLVRTEMLRQIQGPDAGGRPNLYFWVEEKNIEPFEKLLEGQGVPIVQKIPYVRVRLTTVNGKAPGRFLSRRLAVGDGRLMATYRDELAFGETVIDGKFPGRVRPGASVIPVTIAARMRARDLLNLGDEIEWDVEGVPLKTRVAAVRTFNALRFNNGPDVIFPEGFIEGAPKSYEVSARTGSRAASEKVQQAVSAAFPKMQITDVGLIVEAIDRIFNKIAFVIGFMASFIVGTGVVMLASAVMTGRFQRIRETVLLRTLGASRGQVLAIQGVEYAVLGVLSAVVGALLAVGGNLLLAHFVFKIEPLTPPLLLLGCAAAVTAVTLVTGWAANRGVADHPPLAVLRQET